LLFQAEKAQAPETKVIATAQPSSVDDDSSDDEVMPSRTAEKVEPLACVGGASGVLPADAVKYPLRKGGLEISISNPALEQVVQLCLI